MVIGKHGKDPLTDEEGRFAMRKPFRRSWQRRRRYAGPVPDVFRPLPLSFQPI